MSKYFAESELIINEDGSCFHLHLRPEQVADKVILVGDPGRVALVASHFEEKECEVSSREFHAITGTYKGKRITVQSTGIGCDNIDIVVNELDALKTSTSLPAPKNRCTPPSPSYASEPVAACSSTVLPEPLSLHRRASVSTDSSTSMPAAMKSATSRPRQSSSAR